MKYTDQVRNLQEVIHSEMIEYIKQYGYKRDVFNNETLFVDVQVGWIDTATGDSVAGFFVKVNDKEQELRYLIHEGYYTLATELRLIQVADVLDFLLKKVKLSLKPSFDLVMKILNTKMSASLTKVQVCELVRVINGLNDYQYALLITMIDEATA